MFCDPVGVTVLANPLEWQGWDEGIQSLEGYSPLHGTGWCRVLLESYGFEPVYLARVQKDGLSGVVPMMQCYTWLTGSRGVGLPFSDACWPLYRNQEELSDLLSRTMALGSQRAWKSVEWRGGDKIGESSPSKIFFRHELDLSVGSEAVQKQIHATHRRNAVKGKKAGLILDRKDSMEGMKAFYSMHERTRRRHGVPPQPWKFFEKVWQHMVLDGEGEVVLVRKGERPVAGAVFFRLGNQVIYKYGASDQAFWKDCPNHFLFFEMLERLGAEGVKRLDFGRTDCDQEGLRRFKLGWGCDEEVLSYYRYNFELDGFEGLSKGGWSERLMRMKRWVRFMPLAWMRKVGEWGYRHMA